MISRERSWCLIRLGAWVCGACLGVVLLLPVPVHAQAAFDWQQATGVLFRVASPDPAVPGNLLFGTIHVGTLEQLGLDPAKLAAAVHSQHTLVDEADARSPWSRAFDHYRELPPGQVLPDLIGPDAFMQLIVQLPREDSARLERIKPWVAMVKLEAAGVPEAPGVDRIVAGMARGAGLRNVHLETLEDQLAALDCISPDEYAKVLAQRLDDPARIREETLRALAFYREGDLPAWLADVEAAHGLDASAAGIAARSRECLLDQRNARWSEELDPLLRAGGCFVAVGAIHLVGPNGLLAALSARGFTVTPQPW